MQIRCSVDTNNSDNETQRPDIGIFFPMQILCKFRSLSKIAINLMNTKKVNLCKFTFKSLKNDIDDKITSKAVNFRTN